MKKCHYPAMNVLSIFTLAVWGQFDGKPSENHTEILRPFENHLPFSQFQLSF